MQMKRKFIIFLLACESIVLIGSSKCPEARKPHVTSCNIFYNCINLPEGGYVWAPSKCADGLVFQPYLRMCVLPGDTWTCENLSTASSPMTETYDSPELIDPEQTSYLGYTQESSPLTKRPSIEVSYPVRDGISELSNLRVSATPYPLIEISDANEKNVNDDNEKDTQKVALSQAIEHRVENYLYQYFNRHQKISTGNSDNKVQESNVTWLKGFINKILLYENVRASPKRQVFSAVFGSTTCEPPAVNTLKKNDYLNSNILRYLVRSYILGTRRSMLGKSKKKAKKPSSATTTERTVDSQIISDEMDSTDENSSQRETSIDSIVSGLKADNNVVAIEGNLGGREYVTIAKYKSLSTRVNVEVIEVLLCAKGIRLANRTDCMKYYTCDPDTATVVEFSCSSKTAFNDYNRVCEAQRYKACATERLEQHRVSTTVRSISSKRASTLSSTRIDEPANSNPCQSKGKFVDETSEKHYYVCYSSVGNSDRVDAIRMTCPNDLIFCQAKKLCTARRRCHE